MLLFTVGQVMIVNKIRDVAEDDELIWAWYFSIWWIVYGL